MAGINTAIDPGLVEAMKQQMLKDDLKFEKDRLLQDMERNPYQPLRVVKPVNKKVLLLARSK